MSRTDIHRPSAINPEDYDFVAFNCVKLESTGDMMFLNQQRLLLANHKERTGGDFSHHEHGGNCMVCGSVNAVYTATFYHEKTNTYVRVGTDCTDKLWSGLSFEMSRFRKHADDARKNQAGKQKAQALLADRGLERCWEINVAEWNESMKWEERTIRDITDKLVRYGSLSEKQFDFLSSLLGKIDGRVAVEAKRKAEADAAKDAPEGKQKVEVEVVSIKEQDSYYGISYKMLVKSTTDGWKAWGTHPSFGPEVGSTIVLSATFQPSQDDPKFAFFKRPRVLDVLSVEHTMEEMQAAEARFGA